jgi:prophage regulatory protein
MEQHFEILRLKELEQRIGLKKSSIYEKMNKKSKHYDSTFPVTVALGERSVGWLAHEVAEWISSRQRKREEEQ